MEKGTFIFLKNGFVEKQIDIPQILFRVILVGGADGNDVEVSGQHGINDAVDRTPAGTVFNENQLNSVMAMHTLIAGAFQFLNDQLQFCRAEILQFVFPHEIPSERII